ncbi:hypothetical protein [Erythrobacter aureus]|uniref:Uncharacterized protein n=1 Tax=Erythrobacter aureus TaxID=2182384 RepID=A0A345YJ27_9SPHN|nr:hypothetical protein [Erythrobacter aureus]AXK43929.1 hypothetical protein DVR09_15860 [Erythrobacter aureus]
MNQVLPDLSVIGQSIEASMASAEAARTAIADRFTEESVPASKIGEQAGPVHAASLQVWNEVASRAGVPTVEAKLIADIPMSVLNEGLFYWDQVSAPLDDERHASVIAAIDYAKTGGFWRTDLCAHGWVKAQISETGSFELETTFSLDDPRIMDIHFGMPSVTILARPTLTPVRVNGWPVEFRVFFGGAAAEDGAVSFYYPQAGDIDVTPELEAAAQQAREYGAAMYAKRKELGLIPWLPGLSEPDDQIGASIDFMLTEERGLVMIDAGPGFGHGAHPCCFIDSPVEGIRWKLADGVQPR